jgi:ubiquinone/menaquinone biosynthesis C-methylase UbiE
MDLHANGMTPLTLQASRKSWWDSAFTRLLLDAIPLDTRQIVELDCGLASAAHTLLPSLPEAHYLGVDFDPERMAAAKTELEGAKIAPRVELRLTLAASLPVPDASVDIVLSIMSLQHHGDVPAVLAEAVRVLRPGGRLIAVEPDNLGQRFYFDGGLEEISGLLHTLCLRARVARQPSDIALGPHLPSFMVEAGLHRAQMIAHLINSTRMETANSFFTRLRRIAQKIASESGLPPDGELMDSCEQAIKRCLYSGLPKRLGYSCHLVPIFVCVGYKH